MTRLTLERMVVIVKWWFHSVVRRHEVFLDIKASPYCSDCRKFHRK